MIVALLICTSCRDFSSPMARSAEIAAGLCSISGSILIANAEPAEARSPSTSAGNVSVPATPGPFGTYPSSPRPGTECRNTSVATGGSVSDTRYRGAQ